MSDTSLSVHVALALVEEFSFADGLTLLPDDLDTWEPGPIDPVIREALDWELTRDLSPQPAISLDVTLGPVPDPWLLDAF